MASLQAAKKKTYKNFNWSNIIVKFRICSLITFNPAGLFLRALLGNWARYFSDNIMIGKVLAEMGSIPAACRIFTFT